MSESKKPKFDLAKARNVHPSSILPRRIHGYEIQKSVEALGVQQPLIVRPLKDAPGEYELIDGLGRFEALDPSNDVLLDVREGASDSEVFRISEATFKRTERSAYESALFYSEWLKALEKENNTDTATQILLAQKADLSQSAISQYLTINKLFSKLQSMAPNEKFNTLKTWSVTKLYKLSELIETDMLLQVAHEFDKKSEVSIEEVESVVTEKRREDIEAQFNKQRASNPLETCQNNFLKDLTSSKIKKGCASYAKRAGALSNDTHQMLSIVFKQILEDTDRFSSTEIKDLVEKILKTLKKLKRNARILQQRMLNQGQMKGDDARSRECEG